MMSSPIHKPIATEEGTSADRRTEEGSLGRALCEVYSKTGGRVGRARVALLTLLQTRER